MKIDHYSWGKIVIDGTAYSSDVIVYPDHINASWWRKEGHNLHPEDLQDVIATQPTDIIIGTGALGAMKVPEETIAYLESKGISVYIEKTAKAVELFNKLRKEKKLIAALHLTC